VFLLEETGGFRRDRPAKQNRLAFDFKHFIVQTMAVKDDSASSDESDSADERPRPQSPLESDLLELLRVMPRVFRGLRHAPPGRCEPGSKLPLNPRELFKQGGLGPRHIPVVVVLMLDGPMAVSDLAHRLGLSLATVSLMVGELSRAGLVDRHEDEHDRRRTMVSVSERHRVAFEPFVRERIAPLRAAFLQGWRLLAEEFEPDRPPPGPDEV
jgi:DNA-binding MarR family transcriptional regulator